MTPRSPIEFVRQLIGGRVQRAGNCVQLEDAMGQPIELSGSGMYTTPAHTAPLAGIATGAILALNANRLYALFVNDSDTPVYLAFTVNAALNTGIRLNPNGGSYEMSKKLGNLWTGAVNGISGTAGKIVLVTEGV